MEYKDYELVKELREMLKKTLGVDAELYIDHGVDAQTHDEYLQISVVEEDCTPEALEKLGEKYDWQDTEKFTADILKDWNPDIVGYDLGAYRQNGAFFTKIKFHFRDNRQPVRQ